MAWCDGVMLCYAMLLRHTYINGTTPNKPGQCIASPHYDVRAISYGMRGESDGSWLGAAWFGAAWFGEGSG